MRIDWNTKSKKTNEVIRKRFVCNKEGFKTTKEIEGGRQIKRHKETRTGCRACLDIKVTKSNEWVVCKFDDVHNHELTTPSKVTKHRSHSTYHCSNTCKSLIGELNHSGIKPSVILRAINALTGEKEVVLTPAQCSKYIRSERRRNIGRECYGIIKHFEERAASDAEFFFAIDIDEDCMLRNVFWADDRSRKAYTHFGDVLVFDVTYKTNKFQMPFSHFVGVNHHRQSILFGGALLVDETEPTFIWLFKQFLKCMNNVPPLAIITDQDKAMGNAIEKVFPNARHRFCVWHINKHAVEHLASLRAKYNDFGAKYKALVKSNTIEEFESEWELFQKAYNIDPNGWLGKMYMMRKHWVPAYLKDQFFARMTTSGRSESIHAFFYGYLNSNTMLNEFVIQYDVALKARRDAESHEDFHTMNSNAVVCTGNPIEEQAGKWYTRNMFNIFQEEWKKIIKLYHEKMFKEGNVVKYRVGIDVVEKSKWRIVTYESIDDSFKSQCSCAKFETHGILCKHILYVVKKKYIRRLPDYYLLERWNINARYRERHVTNMVNDYDASQVNKWSMHALFNQVMEVVDPHPSIQEKMFNFMKGVIVEASELSKSKEIQSQVGYSQIGSTMFALLSNIDVRGPIAPVKTLRKTKGSYEI